MIEHTRKEIEDDGCLSCEDVTLMNSVLATLDDAASEIRDMVRALEKRQLAHSRLLDVYDELIRAHFAMRRDACPCGEPLDKHAIEPMTAEADREMRLGV